MAAVLLRLLPEIISSGPRIRLRRHTTVLRKARQLIILRRRRITADQLRRRTRRLLLTQPLLRMGSRTESRMGAAEASITTESVFRDNSHTRTTMGRDYCVIAMVTALCYGRTRGLI